MNIVESVNEVISRHGQCIAMETGSTKITYEELGTRINIATRKIQASEVKAQDVVAIIADNTPEFVPLTLGVWQAGAVVLLVDAGRPEKQIDAMLEAANVKLAILASDNFSHRLSVPTTKIDCLAADNTLPLPAHTEQGRLAYICFTSGTTGRPKGIRVSHAALMHFLCWQSSRFMLGEHDKCLQITRLSFDVIYRSIFTGLICGATIVFPPTDINLVSAEIASLMAAHQVSYVHIVPSVLKALLTQLDRPRPLPHLRLLFLAGEKLEKPLVERVRMLFESSDLTVVNLYGPSETVLAKFFYIVPDCIGDDFILPVGQPIPGCRYILVNGETTIDSAETPGEIVIISGYKSDGYIEDGVATFRGVPNSDDIGYYTGDVGYYVELPSGQRELHIHGRLDEQIKINGIRVELAEIDYCVSSLPYIESAATTYSADTGNICCYIVPCGPVLHSVLYRNLKDYLPPELLPHRFVITDRLLYNENGKLARRNLHTLEGTLLVDDSQPPIFNEQLTEKLRKCWCSIFQKDNIELNAEFYAEGGNSLKAALLAVEIERQLLIKIGVKAVLEHTGLIAQANYLDKQITDCPAPLATRDVVTSALIPEQAAFASFQLLNPESAEYNVGYLFEFSDVDNIERLKGKIDRFLRTQLAANLVIAFREQIYYASRPEPVSVQLHHLPDHANIAEAANRLFAAPIDLAQMLLHVHLLQSADRNSLLVIFHHSISDGASSIAFFRALSEFETPLAQSRTDPVTIRQLPPPSAKVTEFWAGYLSGYARPPTFADLKPEGDGAAIGETLLARASHCDFYGICQLAQAHRVSEFAVLLTLFSYVWSRFNRSDEIVVAIPCTQRPEYGADDRFGCYVKTLPVIFSIDRNLTVHQTFRRVSELIADLLDNRFSGSLAEWVRDLGMADQINCLDLFDCFFSYDDFYLESISVDGHLGVRHPLNNHTAKYPFSMMLAKTPSGELRIEIEYDAGKFSHELVRSFVDSFRRVIAQLPKSPAVPLRSLGYAPDGDGILSGESSPVQSETVIHHLLRHLTARPDAIVLNSAGHAYSYRQLWNAAAQIAEALAGLQAGTPVVALLPRGLALVASLVAIWMKNLVYLPVDPRTPQQRLRLIIEDASPGALITNTDRAFADVKRIDTRLLDIDRAMSPPDVTPRPELDAPAYLLYTSGTTGRPKGVLQTHRTLVNLCAFQHRSLSLPDEDVVIAQFASQGFDVSLQTIAFALTYGAQLVTVADEDKLQPQALWDLLAKYRVAMIVLPPAVLQLIAEYYRTDLPLKLRYVLTSGEALVITRQIRLLFEHIRHARLVNQYGPTETHVITQNILPPDPADWEALPSIGVMLDNCSGFVLDNDGLPVPDGLLGELYLSGSNLACGYFNNPALTSKAFTYISINQVTQRVYRTGDLVKVKSGKIFYCGRADDQINLNGFRIEPDDIGKTLARHKNVKQVFITTSLIGGSAVLVAYYTSVDGHEIAVEELQLLMQEGLPFYMHVHHFRQLSQFPLTVNMKIDKKALPAIEHGSATICNEYQWKYNDVQNDLLAMIRSITGSSHVASCDENLLMLGLSSLAIARFLAAIRQKFGITLSFKELYRQPTLAALSELIDERQSATGRESDSFVEIERYYPTRQQYRILNDIFAGQHHSASNLCFAIELAGPVDLVRLRTAIDASLADHDIFRTVYQLPYVGANILEGQFVVGKKLLHPVRMTALPAPAEKVIEHELNDRSFYPFDRGLYTACVYVANDRRVVFLLNISHLVFDGTSAQLLFNEIQDRYNGRFETRRDISYASFSQQTESQDVRDNVAFLEKVLKQVDSLLPLPVRNLPLLKDNPKSSRWLTIAPALTKELLNAAGHTNHPHFTLLTYALGESVKRHATTNRILGVTVSGRESGWANTLGLFSQRTIIDLHGLCYPEDSGQLAGELAVLQQHIHETRANQLLSLYDYPFHSKIKRHKHLATPQFNLVFQNYERNTLQFDRLQCDAVFARNRHYSLDVTDITFVIDERPDSLLLEVVYNRSAIDEVFIDGLVDDFLSCLDRIAKSTLQE